MKPYIFLIIFIFIAEIDIYGCGAPPSELPPSIIISSAGYDQNQISYGLYNPSASQITLYMSLGESYKASLGGYTGTRWSINGIGLVGEGGQSFVMSTVGWTYPPGPYTLKAENQFANGCYGCVSNSVFTKQIYLVPSNLTISASFPSSMIQSTTYPFSVSVQNIGVGYSSSNIARGYWSIDPVLSPDDVLAFAGGVGILEGTMYGGSGDFGGFSSAVLSPTLNAGQTSQTYYLISVVDYFDSVFEGSGENNNIDVDAVLITSSGSSGGRTRGDIVATQNGILGYSDSVESISNLQGKTVWKKGINSEKEFQDVQDGFYIYEVLEEGKIVRRKVVIKR